MGSAFFFWNLKNGTLEPTEKNLGIGSPRPKAFFDFILQVQIPILKIKILDIFLKTSL